MRCPTWLCLLLLPLAACAAPRLSFDYGAAAILYGQARADYATAKLIVALACQGQRLSPAECASLTDLDRRAASLDAALQQQLRTPDQPIDIDKVIAVSQTLSQGLSPLVMKVLLGAVGVP